MENIVPAKSSNLARGVAHHLPHRTRYRVATQHRNSETMTRLQESISKVPGVKKIELNQRTGSVLIHHDTVPEILNALGTVLDTIGQDLFEELVDEELFIFPGVSVASNAIQSRFTNINRYIARLTRNYVDLKMLLPIAFLAAGLYQTSKNRAWLTQVPAWVLFYYAYDSYLKFHNPGMNLAEVGAPGNGHGYN